MKAVDQPENETISVFKCYSVTSKDGKANLLKRKLIHLGDFIQVIGSTSFDKVLFEAALADLKIIKLEPCNPVQGA